MAGYVDGFVFTVPKNRVEDYKKMAADGRDSWIKHGALSYFECVGDDLAAMDTGGGKRLEFTELTKAGPDDTVWFSFIVFESKEHRDEVNRKVMAEMEEKYSDQKDFSMPFDPARLAYGGFSVAVEGRR